MPEAYLHFASNIILWNIESGAEGRYLLRSVCFEWGNGVDVKSGMAVGVSVKVAVSCGVKVGVTEAGACQWKEAKESLLGFQR